MLKASTSSDPTGQANWGVHFTVPNSNSLKLLHGVLLSRQYSVLARYTHATRITGVLRAAYRALDGVRANR